MTLWRLFSAFVFSDGAGVADGFVGVKSNGLGFVQSHAFLVGGCSGLEAELGVCRFIAFDALKALKAVVGRFVSATDRRRKTSVLHFRHGGFRWWIEHET